MSDGRVEIHVANVYARIDVPSVEQAVASAEAGPARRYGVEVAGRLFPVTQAVALAAGIDKSFLDSRTARRALVLLGFRIQDVGTFRRKLFSAEDLEALVGDLRNRGALREQTETGADSRDKEWLTSAREWIKALLSFVDTSPQPLVVIFGSSADAAGAHHPDRDIELFMGDLSAEEVRNANRQLSRVVPRASVVPLYALERDPRRAVHMLDTGRILRDDEHAWQSITGRRARWEASALYQQASRRAGT